MRKAVSVLLSCFFPSFPRRTLLVSTTSLTRAAAIPGVGVVGVGIRARTISESWGILILVPWPFSPLTLIPF